MYYKVTLLKVLPDVEAGFSFSISEDALKDHGSFYFKTKDKEWNDDYNYKCHVLLSYKDNKNWVKIEPDMSRAIKIKCPSCGCDGMFAYWGEKTHPEWNGVDYVGYKHLGLICPMCKTKIHTHSLRIDDNGYIVYKH